MFQLVRSSSSLTNWNISVPAHLPQTRTKQNLYQLVWHELQQNWAGNSNSNWKLNLKLSEWRYTSLGVGWGLGGGINLKGNEFFAKVKVKKLAHSLKLQCCVVKFILELLARGGQWHQNDGENENYWNAFSTTTTWPRNAQENITIFTVTWRTEDPLVSRHHVNQKVKSSN